MTVKKVDEIPWPAALFVAAIVPAWAITVLPLSVIYQVGRFALQKLSSQPPVTRGTNLDSGYVVQDSQIIPRKERKYDVVILGATGFTGKLTARYMAKTYGVGKTVKWAVAGRSSDKLELVKKELADELQLQELLELDTIIVDTSVLATLPKLVEQTRVVATTAGPYSKYGSSVVEFCAKFGTHYVDITAEIPWVKAMVVQWQTTAQETGATLISFCGHDSIPWDISVFKLQELLKKECNDDLADVTFWAESMGGVSGGTIASTLTLIRGDTITTPKEGVEPFHRSPDSSASSFDFRAELPLFIAPSKSPFIETGQQTWTTPFVMALGNSTVVGWSHVLRSSGSRTLVYKEFAQLPDFKTAFTSYSMLIIICSSLLNPLTSFLLERFVFPQPGQGPPLCEMESTSFLRLKGQGIGTRGNKAESIMYFDKDALYLETARMLMESALCLALDEEKSPDRSGGFWTPSTALGNVLLDRLVASGTSFTSKVVTKQ